MRCCLICDFVFLILYCIYCYGVHDSRIHCQWLFSVWLESVCQGHPKVGSSYVTWKLFLVTRRSVVHVTGKFFLSTNIAQEYKTKALKWNKKVMTKFWWQKWIIVRHTNKNFKAFCIVHNTVILLRVKDNLRKAFLFGTWIPV